MDPLTALPVEILTAIALYLHPEDLSKLIRTCKHLSVVGTPLLWSDIEAHGEDHESYIGHDDSPPFRSPSQRPYRTSPYDFFSYMIRTMRYLDHSRQRIIAARVKNLCASPPHGTETFNLLVHFTNLETLELDLLSDIEDCHKEKYTADIESPPLPKLRFAKMFGYIPYRFVKWVLGSMSTLERIEVGILDSSMLTYSGFLH
ncbi:hypothetical protein FALBO_12102 [Fusarium albosuccineum]|uniref:F-box domain-containing protein n=1 Tax=Fusarium albosuccineum TaxID=1237068 RepID=A0A8H4L128_9HYPO|nr:hypothetical protein FALBO_12102 [Fusarium albosuccineum]